MNKQKPPKGHGVKLLNFNSIQLLLIIQLLLYLRSVAIFYALPLIL